MSATNRGGERVPNDFYPTQRECIDPIVKRINWMSVQRACEPCVGSGSIVSACPRGIEWENYEIAVGLDYLLSTPRHVDLVLTNPPYHLALEFLEKSLSHASCVIMLLRLNFLGSQKRSAFLKAHRPSHLYILSERPSFVDVCDGTNNPRVKGCGAAFQKVDKVKKCPVCGGRVKAGTDATEYAWICWDKGILLDPPGIDFI